MKLTSEQAKKVVQLYYASFKSPTRTSRKFNTWAMNNDLPIRVSKKNVIDLINRFENRAVLQKDVRERRSLSKDDKTLMGIVSSLYQHPGSSLRIAASENDLSYTTTEKLARRTLGMYPYRLLRVHALTDYDKLVRVDACQRLLQLMNDDNLIVYSDEAIFRTDGFVNRWDCRLWDYFRPDDFVVETSQGSKHTIVWAGMTRDHLFGPYFFPETVTGDSYRAILSEFFLVDLLNCVGSLNHVWFQQDGASPHTSGDTCAFLRQCFDERVVSKNFAYEWPPRSPDLSPCDFFLWGTVKDMVYKHGRLSTVSELQDHIIAAFNVMRQQRIHHVRNAVMSVSNRFELCVARQGNQLQHS